MTEPSPSPPPQPAPGLPPGRLVPTAWVFYMLLGLGGVVWIGSREGVIPLALFLDTTTWWRDLALGAVGGLVLLVGWNLGARRLATARSLEDRLGALLGPIRADEAVTLAVLSGVAEELFFRGAVQGSWGWLWATLLFGVLHSGPGRVFGLWTAFALVAGGLMGGLMVYTGNLLAPVVAHVLVNAVNLRRLGAEQAAAPARLPDPAQADAESNRRETRTMAATQDVLDRIDRHREEHLDELLDYLRIPSISTDPEYRDEVLAAAEWLRDKMDGAGLTAELVDSPTDGYPMVYGEWTGAPGKPTVLFYGHYDVQPADPLEEWRNPPFEPTREGDNLVARGATDDKGQSYTHVKAVAEMLAERGELPVNVKFLVEGEEESGGESIEAFVRQDGGDKLAADCVVVSDTSMYAAGQPSLLYGLKGLLYMEIRVQGPNRDLHSGTYGGAVRNPANALGHILAALRDADSGKVRIPGFYDGVVPLADWERKAFADLPFDEDAYRADLDVPALHGEEGYSTRERTWARPTLDVNGLWSGYQGAGAKTVLPAKAGAKVSMRLVPGQDPEVIARAFTEYVESAAPSGVRVEVETIHWAHPTLVNTEGPAMAAASEALEAEWGAAPVMIREGGSIPIVGTFAEVLEVPVLLMGFGLPDDRLHSPNEKMNVQNFHGGIRTVARFLDRLAER